MLMFQFFVLNLWDGKGLIHIDVCHMIFSCVTVGSSSIDADASHDSTG